MTTIDTGAQQVQESIAERYARVRAFTETLVETLEPEDTVVQPMPDASPAKWHLAHTTWFFETFLLAPRDDYRPFNGEFAVLFNSYYNAVGEQFPRPRRGLLTRPTLAETIDYRRHVDEHLAAKLEAGDLDSGALRVVEIGLHHEQQHQELLVTDVKHALSQNPLEPVFRPGDFRTGGGEARWLRHEGGVVEIGHEGPGFAYDNESPRHETLLRPFDLASLPATCGAFLEFIEDGGYRTPVHWLSEGWATVQREGWDAPLYWRRDDDGWSVYTAAGRRPLDPAAPVCCVSYFEADAFARWAGARLPTEAEWEAACRDTPLAGEFADTLLEAGLAIHPQSGERRTHENHTFSRAYGSVWEWTASPYTAYPGYRPPDGALGEYNGKFMCNQFVLRGGSVATSSDHVRVTYRNFFPAGARWQFSGLRLARDAD